MLTDNEEDIVNNPMHLDESDEDNILHRPTAKFASVRETIKQHEEEEKVSSDLTTNLKNLADTEYSPGFRHRPITYHHKGA